MVADTQGFDVANLTLREGLNRFRAENGLEEELGAAIPSARALMDHHDILHVLFGLDTSLRQEALVDLWWIFGTTAQLHDVLEYLQLPEEKAILDEIGWWRVTLTALRAVPDVFRVAITSHRLKRKWPCRDYSSWLDRKLREIRDEFGVTLLAE